MKIYSYDLQGNYTGESVADESPLEKGVYFVSVIQNNQTYTKKLVVQ